MIKNIDFYFANIIHNFAVSTNGGFTPFFKFLTSLGNYGLGFIILTILLLIFKRSRHKAICLVLALILSIVICFIIKCIVKRDRPYLDNTSDYYNFWLYTGSLTDKSYSFPSGHTTAASATGFVLFFKMNKKYSFIFLLIPFIMGFTRIYFSVHYFTDCLAGLLLGFVCAIISIKIADKYIIRQS